MAIRASARSNSHTHTRTHIHACMLQCKTHSTRTSYNAPTGGLSTGRVIKHFPTLFRIRTLVNMTYICNNTAFYNTTAKLSAIGSHVCKDFWLKPIHTHTHTFQLPRCVWVCVCVQKHALSLLWHYIDALIPLWHVSHFT